MLNNHYTQLLLARVDELGITDNVLAQTIGVSPQAISQYRRKGAHMSDKCCVAISALVGEQQQIALIRLHADRADDPDAARLLQDAAGALAMFTDIRRLISVPSKLDFAPKPGSSRRRTGPRRKRNTQ